MKEIYGAKNGRKSQSFYYQTQIEFISHSCINKPNTESSGFGEDKVILICK